MKPLNVVVGRSEPIGKLRFRYYMPALLLVCVAGNANTARAQLIQQYFPDDLPGYAPDFEQSVLNRMYIQQTATGVEVGDYVVRPQLSENAGYDSNTLGKAGSASSELESNAGVQIASDWERNALELNLNVDDHRYFNVASASYTNWQAAAQGSVLLGNDSLKYSYSHSAFNLAATDLGVFGVTTPVGYAVDDARVAYEKLFSRFSLTPSFEFENFAFGRSSGEADLNYDTINHHTELESLAGSYEATPGNAAVAILRSSQAQFPNATGDGYFDAAGFAGIDLHGNGILQSRLLGGAETRRFSGHGLGSLTIPTFEISFTWIPTRLDNITAAGIRRLDDPVSPFALASKIIDGRLTYDHELRANVFLSAAAEVEQSDSKFSDYASGSGEKQTQLNFGMSAVWDIRSNVSASLSYAFSKTSSRSSSGLPAIDNTYPNFSSHTVLVGIKFYE